MQDTYFRSQYKDSNLKNKHNKTRHHTSHCLLNVNNLTILATVKLSSSPFDPIVTSFKRLKKSFSFQNHFFDFWEKNSKLGLDSVEYWFSDFISSDMIWMRRNDDSLEHFRLLPHRPHAPEVRVEDSLQQLVRGQGDPELRGGAAHPRHRALPERAEPFLRVDLPGGVQHPVVHSLPRSCLHLKPRLDHISRSHQRRRWRPRDGSGSEDGQWGDVPCLICEAFLEMSVSWEVDCGEGNISEKAGCGTFIQAKEAQLLHGGPRLHFRPRGDLSGHLQPDLDDLERVGEQDLASSSARASQDFTVQGDVPALFLRHFVPHEIIDGEFYGFFRSYSH